MKKTGMIFLMLAGALCGFGQNKTAQIDQLMKSYAGNNMFNGCVLVAEKGKTIYSKAFGKANMEWNVGNTLDSRFRIASLSKPFTALLVLRFAEEGKLKLTDPASKYLPEFNRGRWKDITIGQLLAHTSGICDYGGIRDYELIHEYDRYTREEYINLYTATELLFEPGTQYHYTSFGYFSLAVALERISGKSTEVLLREYIFDKAGMANSTTAENKGVVPNLCDGYRLSFTRYFPIRTGDPSTTTGSGHIITTVGDYLKFYNALKNHQLLSAQSLKTFYAEQTSGRAFAWELGSYVGPDKKDTLHMAWYTGQGYGFNSMACHMTDDDKLIVLLMNVQNPYFHDITNQIRHILYGQPFELCKPSLAVTLAAHIERQGLAGLRSEFEKQKTKCAHNPYEFNQLGYAYLAEGRTKEAIEVFKINLEKFPDNPIPWDSLGEAYMKDGQKEQAIVHYKKSLELDPNNTNAANMLKKLEGK